MSNTKFQKRHYEAIAEAVRNTKTREDLIEYLIGTFVYDNGLFDRARFEKAAGL